MATLDWQREGKDWPHRDASRFLRAGNVEWHVQVMGEGPDLLLVHGTGASTHSWRGLMPLLATRFRVIAPDLPGHGFSRAASMMQLSLPGMANAVGHLMMALEAMPKIAIGHSAGGPVLARLSLDKGLDLERLITLNAAFMPFKGLAGQIFPPIARALIWNPLVPQAFAWGALDPTAVRKLLEGTGSVIDEEGYRLYARLFRNRGHVSAALNMMARWDLEPLLAELPELKPHLTLIAGKGDKMVPPGDQADIAALVPGAELVEMEGLGHLAHEEAPERIAALI